MPLQVLRDLVSSTAIEYLLDSDPRTYAWGSVNADPGSLLVRTDVPTMFYKSVTDPATTAWFPLGVGAGGEALINVEWYGATGDGNPASGPANDVAIAAALAAGLLTNRGLYFPKGTGAYYFSINLVIPKTADRYVILGDVGTQWNWTGVGVCIFWDGGTDPIVGLTLFGCLMRNIIINGTINMTIGVRLRAVDQSQFDNIEVRNCVTAALRLETCTGNLINNFACTTNRVFFIIQPADGLILDKRVAIPPDPAGMTCTMNVFLNCTLEGLQAPSVGINVLNGVDNMFISCPSEGCSTGVNVGQGSVNNQFQRLELIQNVVADIVCDGEFNVFENCASQAAVTWTANAKGNVLRGGTFDGAIVNNAPLPQYLDGPCLNSAGAIAAFNDPLSPGRYYNNVGNFWQERLPGLQVFANRAAALGGGLVAGDVYYDAAGIVMVV